jgi:hypothetical protein
MAASAEMVSGVRGRTPPVHPVKVYEDDDGLAKAVAEYVTEGLKAGETVIVVATPSHWKAFAEQLRAAGVDAGERLSAGQLTFLEARATLARFMSGNAPNRTRFEEVIGRAMDEASVWRPQAPVRAYGEMVDILWQEGRLEAALRLEECWQDLMARRPFSLLCGYKVSVLDSPEQGEALEKICACHTAFIPAFDPARLESAVFRAFESVLGEARAKVLRPLMAANISPSGLGLAESAVLWLRKNLSVEAESLVERARLLYEKGA